MEEGEEEEVLEDNTRPKPVEPKPEPKPKAKPKPKPKPTEAKPKPVKPKRKPVEPVVVKPKPKPAKPKPAKPTPAKPVAKAPVVGAPRTIVAYAFGQKLPAEVLVAVTAGLTNGLDAARYTVIDVDALYLDAAGEERDLRRADNQLEHAAALLQELDIPTAESALASAMHTYEQHLLRLVERDGGLARLGDVYRLQATARFLDGDDDGARAVLKRCFVLDPALDYDKKLFPPDMEQLVNEERLLFDELGRGALVVGEASRGAQVYVNGVARGLAPLEVADLPAGPNYVTLVMPGHPVTTTTVLVDGGAPVQVDEALPLHADGPAAALRVAASEVGKSPAGPLLRAAHEQLGSPDELLLAVAAPASTDELALSVYRYDMTSGKLIQKGERRVPAVAPTEATAELAQSLTSGALPFAPGSDESRPLWKRRYFWHVTAGAAALVVIGVVVGVASAGLSNAERVVILGVSF